MPRLGLLLRRHILHFGENTHGLKNVKKTPTKLPIFLVSGQNDPVGDLGEGVKKVYYMYEEAGLRDVTYKLYENDRHELINEPDKEIVFNDILSWMEVHITT